MSTGAGNDIERATELARKMVCEWGMSDLGPLTFGKKEEQIFLGREIAQHRDYSEATAIQIDEEVRKMVSSGYETAKTDLSENRETLETDRKGADRARGAGCYRNQDAGGGQELPPLKPLPAKTDEDVQQVLKPERSPAAGGERPATA